MPHIHKDPYRRHLAAFLATGAFLFVAAAGNANVTAYVTPEEAGFLDMLPEEVSEAQTSTDQNIVCAYEDSGKVMAVISVAEMNRQSRGINVPTDQLIVARARAHAKVLEELALVTESENLILRGAAPDDPREQQGPVAREIARWFGL